MKLTIYTLVGGLFINAVAIVPIALFTLGSTAAFFIAYMGTTVWIMIHLLDIVFGDSKSRWPGVPAFQRFARVLTFYRD